MPTQVFDNSLFACHLGMLIENLLSYFAPHSSSLTNVSFTHVHLYTHNVMQDSTDDQHWWPSS